MTRPSRRAERVATFFGTIVWTWILLGFWYEFDHITVSDVNTEVTR